MKGLYLLLKRFVHPYKRYVVLAFVFNVLGALFGAFQFATIQPVLGVLFKTQNIVAKPAEWALSIGSIKDNILYQLGNSSRWIGRKTTCTI